MSTDPWRRMSELFDQALDLPPADREAYLGEQCGDDRSLHRALEILLEADQEVEREFLEEPPIVTPATSEHREVEPPTDHIGPYRLVKKIGEGGMGTVFLARRSDEAFERRMAIKVIRRGMESAAAVRRLLVERQILARLEHPSIARLYDGGTTPEGLPYFVMEYVDGLPIDVYCAERRLPVDEQITLFIEICGAVAYAHRNLVVHRDLKPSNILVMADGTVKLLDFGIAKLLEPGPAASAVETASWQRFLSPSYASPEQVEGRPITTVSDIYSLGVVFYRLLTGRLPFLFKGRSLAQISRILATREPARPSVAARQETGGRQAHERGRKLRGDLDHIVLKALRGDAASRYSSAENLAEDLRRYKMGFPVEARQGNIRYGVGKFLRRNWAAAAVVALMVTLISVFTLDKASQNTRLAQALDKTAEERDRAQRESDEKNEVIGLVLDLFEFADPSQSKGETITVREVLDHSSERLARFADQPAVEATLRRVVGWTYLSLGLIDDAQPHLEHSLELNRQLYGEDSVEAALSLSRFAFISLWRGGGREAQTMMEEAVAQVRRKRGDHHPDLIEPLNNLVTLLCYTEDFGAAANPSNEALGLARRYAEQRSSEMAEATVNRAVVLKNHGELKRAERLYEEALEIHIAWIGEMHPDVAAIFNNLGVLSGELGKVEDAQRFHQRALVLRRQLYPDGHKEIVQSLNHIARLRQRQGDVEGAESAYLEALELVRELRLRGHPRAIPPAVGLASLWTENGKPQEAEELLREGLDQWRNRLPEGHGLLAWAESTLGGALIALERFAEAQELLEGSLPALREVYGPGDERPRDALRRHIVLWENLGEPERAAQYRRQLAEAGSPVGR